MKDKIELEMDFETFKPFHVKGITGIDIREHLLDFLDRYESPIVNFDCSVKAIAYLEELYYSTTLETSINKTKYLSISIATCEIRCFVDFYLGGYTIKCGDILFAQ